MKNIQIKLVTLLVSVFGFKNVFATANLCEFGGCDSMLVTYSPWEAYILNHGYSFIFWAILFLTFTFAIIYVSTKERKSHKIWRVTFWISFSLSIMSFLTFVAPNL